MATRMERRTATMWLHGNLLSQDLRPLQNALTSRFIEEVGSTTVLLGSEMFRAYVHGEQRPPQYETTAKGARAQRLGKFDALSLEERQRRGMSRPVKGSGYGWYSGTLRRSLHSRIHRKSKLMIMATMGVDRRKGQPPAWASGNHKNAYEYIRYLEYGTRFMDQRPIMTRGFEKGVDDVAQMMEQMVANQFVKMALEVSIPRKAIGTRAGSVMSMRRP